MTGLMVMIGSVGMAVTVASGRWYSRKRLEQRFAAVLDAVAKER